MLHFLPLAAVFAPVFHDGLHERMLATQARIGERPLDASLRVELSSELREHAEFARALDELETARRLDPCAARIHFECGASLQGLGRDAEAEAEFTLAIECAPNDALAHRSRAESRARQVEFAAALEDREAVVRLAQAIEPEIFLELADAQLSLGATDDALATLDRGIKILGLVPGLALRAIECEEQRSHTDAALTRLETWGKTLARKEQAFVLRGEILERAQRPDDARRAWENALRAIDALPVHQQSTLATRELAERAREGQRRIQDVKHSTLSSIKSQP